MELVDDKKIEAICEFIGNGHVGGEYACRLLLKSLPEKLQKEIDAPCKLECPDNYCYCCPFYTKESAMQWVKSTEEKENDKKMILLYVTLFYFKDLIKDLENELEETESFEEAEKI